ncbi:PilW family protein [Dyella sp. KRB-257]|uniref:PilW family protein n=1 Tax=Dyella sp. KRB-257 TaxID=3400915 RepID=UPI003BFCA6AE
MKKYRSLRQAAGFTLVELMIAMLLGLIVVGGAVSVFLAGQNTYTTNTALADVQENSRVAFEMLMQDLRAAGLTGCDNAAPVANVLQDQDTQWYANFGNAVHGYTGSQTDPAVTTGTALGQRVTGTDSVQILSANDAGLSIKTYDKNSAQFTLNQPSPLVPGDIIVVCDPTHTAITQVTGPSSASSTNVEVVSNTGNTVYPGNCSKGLGFPPVCTPNGNQYVFQSNSQIIKLQAHDWYIGYNSAGTKSLFRGSVNTHSSNTSAPAISDEMVRDVTDMQLRYHVQGEARFKTADLVADWSRVDAVQATLTLESTNKRASTAQQAISRKFTATATIRNRVN